MLEVGAGAGRNTPRYHNFSQIVLVDYSLTQMQKARQRLGDSERYVFIAGDVYNLPFVDGLFDAATMIRVIHHLVEPQQALRDIRRTLEPGAAFILEYANKQNIKAMLRYLLGRQSWSPYTPEPVEFVELNYNFHPRAVESWLGSAGFDLQRTLTVSHYRIDVLKRTIPTGILVWLDQLAQLTGDWWQLTPSVFTRNNAAGETPIASKGDFFRCPACKSALPANNDEALVCEQCGSKWAIRDGIYDFRQPMK